MTLRLISRAALLLALAAALPARAGLFDDDEARARVDQLRRELTARIDKNEAAQHGQIDLANQIEALRQEMARLRGENEVSDPRDRTIAKAAAGFCTSISTIVCASWKAGRGRTRTPTRPPAA